MKGSNRRITHEPLLTKSMSAAYSLIELLISLGLGLFIVSGVLISLIANINSYSSTNQVRFTQDSGRAALHMILGSYRNSGYLGLNGRIRNSTNVTNASISNATCSDADTTWLSMMEQPIFGLNNTKEGYDCLSGSAYTNDSDVLVMRHVSAAPVTTYEPTKIYVRSSLFQSELFRGDAEDSVGISEVPQNTHEALAYGYYVGTSENSCSEQPIPSLFQIVTSESGQPIHQEIIPGIEMIEAEYLHGGEYKSADELALNEWGYVKAVKVWIIARAPCPNYNEAFDRTFDLPSGNFPDNADNYYRQLFTGTVSIRNATL